MLAFRHYIVTSKPYWVEPVVDAECPSGYPLSPNGPYGWKAGCFKVVCGESQKTWYEAESACKSDNGQLAVPKYSSQAWDIEWEVR